MWYHRKSERESKQGSMSANETEVTWTSLEGLGIPLPFPWTTNFPVYWQVLCWSSISETAIAHMANPSEGLRNCLFSPFWWLPLAQDYSLPWLKWPPGRPKIHLTLPLCGAALLVCSPKSILTLKTAELHFLCEALVKLCQRVRGPWEHLDYN